MKIIDVTLPLSESTIAFPGDPYPRFTQTDTGRYLISDISLTTHSGTHIDAPAHYLKAGDTIDTIPLDHLIGTCRVLDVRSAGSTIDAGNIAKKIDNVERLLLKTTYSGSDEFIEDYPCLTPRAAKLLTRKGVKCIGIDSPSIESYHCDGTVHRELLSNGCIIIEFLDLTGVAEGDYDMAALPLRLAGLDGSPARVILIKRNGRE